MFLTFSPLSSNAGHLARLKGELPNLEQLCEVIILCLNKYPDDNDTKNKYKKTTFLHYPLIFSGWNVSNLGNVTEDISKLIDKVSPDLVILQMEVWDLMRELGKKLKGKVKFATVLHAMPFLTSPINPTTNFKNDITKYVSSGIESYRKRYILDHYLETYEVFKNVLIIANNKTVAFYFKNYFNNLSISILPSSSVIKKNNNYKISKNIKYDFAYMARIEKGKGLEYLTNILKLISLILSRPVSIVILGRTDDSFSKIILEKMLLESKTSDYFKIDYLGWVDDETKKKILPHCGVFLYPSHYDNYPTTVNEALSFGLPVVTWNVPFSEIIYYLCKAVKRVKIFDFQEFAQSAVFSLINRDAVSTKALNFTNSFDSIDKVSALEIKLFKSIVRAKNE